MGKRKWIIILLTVLLLRVAVFIWKSEYERIQPLEFLLVSQEKTERLTAWEKEPWEYYVFLPSYGQLSQLQLWDAYGGALRLEDTLIQKGMTCQDLRLDQRYILYSRDGSELGGLTFVQSANLPTLFIDTVSHSMDYVHKKKGNEEPGSLRLYSPEGETTCTGRLDAIKMRGNNTMYQEKESYNLTLSQEADLLGMGAARKWALMSNAFDPSHMRNKIVYDFAAALGLAYSPECRWTDVYLNGEYVGLYLLSERNEVHPQRVALKEADHFLVSREVAERLDAQSLPYITTSRGAALRIRACSFGTGTLEEIWRAAENAIEAENGIDPITGRHWSDLIDLDSWAKKYLIEEVFGNVDGSAISQFFYMDGAYPGSKIFAGPVWDYDLAMGCQRYNPNLTPEIFYVNRPAAYSVYVWYNALLQDPLFFDYMVQVYTQQFLPLLDTLLNETLADYQAQIQQAAWVNQLRWNTLPMEPELEFTKDYMGKRAAYLNKVWQRDRDLVTVTVHVDTWNDATYGVFAGDPAPQVLWDKAGHWYIKPGDEPFDVKQPISEDIYIYYKSDPPLSDDTGAVPPPEEPADPVPEWSFFAGMGLLLIVLYLADRIRSNHNGAEERPVRRDPVSSNTSNEGSL